MNTEKTERKFSDLKKRTFVSLSVVAVVALLVFFSYFPIVEIIITLLIAAIVVIGVWEFAHFCKAKNIQVSSLLMMLFGALEVLAIYLNGVFAWAVEFPIGVMLLAIFVFFCSRCHRIPESISTIAVQFFAICYIAVPLGLMLKILYPGLSSHFNIRDGRVWFAYLICISKVTDIGAYFGGRLFGKRKLAPVLSPSKTIEGAIAGFVFAIALSVIFCFIGKWLPNEVFELPLLNAILLGTVLSLGGQLGDLAESLLKRDAGVKDSNQLPGLGGILDMFDSLLFTIPILFFYLHTV
jgi:phosphatidate cytidylyltransferase